MFLELSFNTTLKENYLEENQNKRVDHLLSTLHKISRDKAYEQLIKAQKGKITQSQRDNNERHKQVESIPSESVLRKNDGSWKVRSTTDANRSVLSC